MSGNNMKVLLLPNPMLRTKCDEVKNFESYRETVAEMSDVMRANGGIGLAAPQVGINARIVIVSRLNGEDIRAFNPTIAKHSKYKTTREEGCLSIPMFRRKVKRWQWVDVSWSDVDGNQNSERFHGLMASVWQHEIDHLDGKLIID